MTEEKSIRILIVDDHAVVRWGNEEIHLEHHPGPQPGAAWLVIPDRQLAFVGDAVLVKQPPFLEHADIPVWIDTLDILHGLEFRSDGTVDCGQAQVSVYTLYDDITVDQLSLYPSLNTHDNKITID